VYGLRGDSSIEERARLDNYYIENWSLWQDLVILARTFGSVVRFGQSCDNKPRDNEESRSLRSLPLPEERPAARGRGAAQARPVHNGIAAAVQHSEHGR
jgi:hypothetical protein